MGVVCLCLVTAVHEDIVFAAVTMEVHVDTHLRGEEGREGRKGQVRGKGRRPSYSGIQHTSLSCMNAAIICLVW